MPDRKKIIKAWEHFDTIMEVATHLAYPDYSVVQKHCLALLSLLKEQPQIILCKDCKYRDPEDKMCDSGHGIRWQLPREDNWFCADGVKKEDE